jgi:hypothetical protein
MKMYTTCSIPPQVINKFKDLFNKHHIVDMMIVSPYIHIYYLPDGTLKCDSAEDLSKHISKFEEVITYYKNKS